MDEEYKIGSYVFTSWKIVRFIGEGTCGKVYEIEKNKEGQVYRAVLKVITIPRSRDDIERFRSRGMTEQEIGTYYYGLTQRTAQEISRVAGFEPHRNIVPYGACDAAARENGIGWNILIRMEYLTPLSAQLNEKPLSSDDALRLGREICSALIFCEKNKVMHRDIKPGNIFVSKSGQFMLGDLGLSVAAGKPADGSEAEKETIDYMAPELYKGKASGKTVDIYSLGMMLYRFMNDGRLPFYPPYPQPVSAEARKSALHQRHIGTSFPAPGKASVEFAKVILKACAYRPEERYQSASDMLADLMRIREPESPEIEFQASNYRPNQAYNEAAEKIFGQEFREFDEQAQAGVDSNPDDYYLDSEDDEPDNNGNGDRDEEEDRPRRSGSKSGIFLPIIVIAAAAAVFLAARLLPSGVRSRTVNTPSDADQQTGGLISGTEQQNSTAASGTDQTAGSNSDSEESRADGAATEQGSGRAAAGTEPETETPVVGNEKETDVSAAAEQGTEEAGTEKTTERAAAVTEQPTEEAESEKATEEAGAETLTEETGTETEFAAASGAEINSAMIDLAGGSEIRLFAHGTEEACNAAATKTRFTDGGGNTVSLWYSEDTQGIFWWSEGGNDKLVLPADSSLLFYSYDDAEKQRYAVMKLSSIDTADFDTSRVTDMSGMFAGCEELISLDLSGFNTSQVTDMSQMFFGTGMTELDVSTFDTSQVTDMHEMFSCGNFRSLDLSTFSTGSVTDMSGMFAGCIGLASLNISGFDTSNVTDMHAMFQNCGRLTGLDVSGFDMTSVTDTTSMFDGVPADQIPEWYTAQ